MVKTSCVLEDVLECVLSVIVVERLSILIRSFVIVVYTITPPLLPPVQEKRWWLQL